MGVSVSPHRVVNMRNPRTRVVLAATLLFVLVFVYRRQNRFVFRRPVSASNLGPGPSSFVNPDLSRTHSAFDVDIVDDDDTDANANADASTGPDTDAFDASDYVVWLEQPEHPPGYPDWSRQPPVPHVPHPQSQPASARDRLPAAYSHVPDCSIDRRHMAALGRRYGLGTEFEYMKRYVEFSREPVPRKGMTTVDEDLLVGDFTIVDLGERGHRPRPEKCPPPLRVPVPESPLPSAANLSDFVFGVSTTFERVAGSPRAFDEWSYWLTDGRGNSNGGKLILLLLDATENQLEQVGSDLGRIGVDAEVLRSDSSEEMAVRYLSAIQRMYESIFADMYAGTHENTHENMHESSDESIHPEPPAPRSWLVMCDDDTFFPYPHGLVERLAEFDPARMYYVGALSEDAMSLQRHGSEAYGGAGVFISAPLVRVLAENHAACRSPEAVQAANSGWGAQGDLLLRNCIYTHTDVRMTGVWDLWQMDLMADPAGFFEGGLKPLSVHHYGGKWYRAAPYQIAKLAHTCGEDCTLLRFRTADDFVVSAGWSVAWYPDGADAHNWDQVEHTFAPIPPDRGWNFDYKLGPQRPSLLATGKKLAWEMQRARLAADGSVVQTYVRWRDDWRWVEAGGEPMADRSAVLELVWVPAEEKKKKKKRGEE